MNDCRILKEGVNRGRMVAVCSPIIEHLLYTHVHKDSIPESANDLGILPICSVSILQVNENLNNTVTYILRVYLSKQIHTSIKRRIKLWQ